ncbi:UDP-3-O-(3-hydroxymyristoyl)glucosamine N-acyltransferase [Leptothermofonsia sichuanensis E412]|jgi:UDP-3-O-[3-hydroxymyristoyl] glucosamine N-acyltransferase|uniref:UDP-3-O-(3-hydroxymyristoyl)glucosamine N-acyltransferase n=1 Tax=Leptothermofonsia sichuanensis TaxID=2917832 RepID=UPI001CA759DB|nr:UDP-3-O-(3-hydroxymyristoyl)glucosamine N-acyltransferase [Leptothermofonsia sichuanensis]QZZ21259.1 UDP-3-O-(3-hydroxymyristoyl)glucosamine N-acyltransferase [Leptothermofonsia sichuanensis E412]
MKFSELLAKLNAANSYPLPSHAKEDIDITGVAAIAEATPGSLSYIEGAKFAAQVQVTQASALVLPRDTALQTQATARGIAWIEANDPRLVFAQAIALFYQPFKPSPAIHPTAVIDPSATIGQDVAIGAHVVIQSGVTIGDRVCIHPNVVVYPGARVGDRTVLHANCVIQERTHIGADCIIHCGAVVGSEGFGFVPTPEGWYKMEQSGYVVLEDGVEIGCNSTIDRPAVGETRIARNTKLDNLVHIGHGCQIGQNCAMAAQVGLAGGVKIGNRVMLGGQVGAANQTVIGDGAQIGAQAGVHSHIKAGDVVIGTPAMPYKTFLKVSAIIQRLPEMHKALKELQQRLGSGD